VSTDGRTGGPSAAEEALSMLARRPLTEAEVRRRLAARDHSEEAVGRACAYLREGGYVDDERLALDFIVLRAERLGHGPSRLIDELCRRGVEREVAAQALRRAIDQGDIDPQRLLRRRLERLLRSAPSQPDIRDRARVYNALRRAGFDDDAIGRELASLDGPEPHEEPRTDETTDELS